MSVDDFIKIFDKYGLKGLIIFLILTLIFIFIKSKWFATLVSRVSDLVIENFTKKKTSKEVKARVIEESDIINHDIFNYIDFWMYSKIPTFQFSTEYRTVVFRKYLTIYLKKHKENIKRCVEDKSFEKMTDAELWTSLLKLINDIIYDYEREMDSVGIPRVIIDKMKVKNNDTISLTIDLIEGVCNSQFYNSEGNFLKVYSILNIVLSILENTITNSEQICNSINGQLKGCVIIENGKQILEP